MAWDARYRSECAIHCDTLANTGYPLGGYARVTFFCRYSQVFHNFVSGFLVVAHICNVGCCNITIFSLGTA